MKTIIRLEELAKWIFAWMLTLYLGFNWWIFFAFLFLPDVSMIGYFVNKKTGAILYNIVHHQALAIGVILAGYLAGNLNLEFAGLVLFGHSAMDRFFGYGLKYFEGFMSTHLGKIGA